MSDNNVRLQNLREFTVQIRDANDQIVGTGMAVSTDGKIVTCAHVVEAAGIDPRNSNGAEVGVYFPQSRGGEGKNLRATISKYFEDADDDIVMLQLSGSSPLAPEQIPVLGAADSSENNPFRSYGYRRLDKYVAGWAHGRIQGLVEAPEGINVQCEPVQLESSQINSGMSGSAVLDMERNLVVGIVSETWFPDLSTKDRDTAWAVDGHVLSLAPLGLPVQDAPLPLKSAPEPKFDKEEAKSKVLIKEKYSWHYAPAVLKEWTGRDHLLEQITADWNDPKKHVTGLIGFGGEGKSSLARKWVDSLPPFSQKMGEGQGMGADGLFWWGFYENRSVDEFIEAALKYMSGGRIDPRVVPSSNLRVQIIGAMLGTGRYLFVLDGLEVLQYQEGDQYGLLQSNDLRDLLTFFARPDNQSFCLITSRAPLLDLMDYTTYTHRDVERLSEEDGRALLRRLGVKGSDAELDKVVADWDGHALTLSILAAYLAEQYGGNIKHLADIPLPTAKEDRYERVHRILRRYDKHLTDDEREFLKLFSVFRLPVQESAFEQVFEPLLGVRATQLSKPDSAFSKLFKRKETSEGIGGSPLRDIVNRLVTYRLIRHDEHENSYTTHPLIRNHYFALFIKDDPSQEKAAHEQIKDYYLSIAGDTPEYPTLDDLKPFIEVVHHACQARGYDEAWRLFEERIEQGDLQIITSQLGAYETDLTIMHEFFKYGDITKEPQVSSSDNRRFILNEIGFDLMSTGRLSDAVPFYERVLAANLAEEDWHNTSISYRNLTELYIHLGALEKSNKFSLLALDLSLREKDERDECQSMCNYAWGDFLLGKIDVSRSKFLKAQEIQKKIVPYQYLYSNRGIYYADCLRRTDQIDYARRVTEANLQICEQQHWANQISWCHRVLGDLDFDSGDHETARVHYESALKIARSISVRYVLIEALLARGMFFAKHHKDLKGFQNLSGLEQAFSDLNEALGYCVESGYRIYEADARVALAGHIWQMGKMKKQNSLPSAHNKWATRWAITRGRWMQKKF